MLLSSYGDTQKGGMGFPGARASLDRKDGSEAVSIQQL